MDVATYERHLVALLFEGDGEAGVAALANERGSAERWRRYRRMVRDRLEELVETSFPRLRAVVDDAHGPGGWSSLVARWLASSPPRTPYLRDVHGEFARWAEQALARDADVPPWAASLARYERALLETSYVAEEQGARPTDAAAGAFAMDRPAVLTPAHEIVRARWAVHRVADDGDASLVVEGNFALCVYRDPSTHAVRVLELGAFAAALLESIARSPDRALVDVVRDAAEASHEIIDGALVSAFADLVADLMDRGVWLGARAEIEARR